MKASLPPEALNPHKALVNHVTPLSPLTTPLCGCVSLSLSGACVCVCVCVCVCMGVGLFRCLPPRGTQRVCASLPLRSQIWKSCTVVQADFKTHMHLHASALSHEKAEIDSLCSKKMFLIPPSVLAHYRSVAPPIEACTFIVQAQYLFGSVDIV